MQAHSVIGEEGEEKNWMNFEKARELALPAIDDYLVAIHRFDNIIRGLWHGSTGKNRAYNLKNYLSAWNEEGCSINDIQLLTVFLAIFGEPGKEYVYGRSSGLAGLITDYWIRGNKTAYLMIGYPPIKDGEVKSSVFSQGILTEATQSPSNYRRDLEKKLGAHVFYLDKTEASRYLLDRVLNSAEFQEHKSQIIESASKLRIYLESDRTKFDRDLALSFSSQEEQKLQLM